MCTDDGRVLRNPGRSKERTVRPPDTHKSLILNGELKLMRGRPVSVDTQILSGTKGARYTSRGLRRISCELRKISCVFRTILCCVHTHHFVFLHERRILPQVGGPVARAKHFCIAAT